MQWSDHALSQLVERFDGVVSWDEANSTLNRVVSFPDGESHVVVKRLSAKMKSEDLSNGNLVIAVVKRQKNSDPRVATIMFRREGQPIKNEVKIL